MHIFPCEIHLPSGNQCHTATAGRSPMNMMQDFPFNTSMTLICDFPILYSYVIHIHLCFPPKTTPCIGVVSHLFRCFFPWKNPSTTIGDFPVMCDDSVDGICWSHWDRQLCRESCSIHGIEGAIYPSVIPDQCRFIAGKNIGNYENINKCRF